MKQNFETSRTSEQVREERIKEMEQRLDRASAAVKELSAALDRYEEVQDALRELSEYYGGDEWKQDFAEDEAGRLPQNLKRGVLSEDGVWNVLSDSRELNVRMLETVAEILKK